MHDLGLVVTLSAALATALVFGYYTHRLGLSPILGYLLAGIALGPNTPGFIADAKIAGQLAELGVVLLMFGVGLHFHLKDLLAVKSIAIPGAIGQSIVATALGAGMALWAGWSFSAGLVLGVGISVASTVVLMRVLVDNRRLDSPEGHVAVGWLVVEDIFTVLALVLLPALFGPTGVGTEIGGLALTLGIAVLKLGLLVFLLLFVGGRVIPWMLTKIARTRSAELFTLTILALALVLATGSALLFGVSMALGAFLAGMVVGQSKVSHQAAADALPLRDAFAVLFFVSVGMLFDPQFVLERPALVLGTLAIILIGKPLAALAIVLLLGHSVRTGLTVAIGLAQIGEFSFILAEMGRRIGVLPGEGHSLLVAGALISITINPPLFRAIEPIENWLRCRRRLWRLLNRGTASRAETLQAQAASRLAQDEHALRAVVVGYGPVGQTITRLLREFNIQPVVVDLNLETITELAAAGHPAIYGDAARAEILKAAGIGKARYLLVTLPDLAGRLPVIITARELNADLKIFVRARYLGERSMLEEVGATWVCYEEAEAAVALADTMLREVGADQTRIENEANKIRDEFALRRPAPILPTVSDPPGP